MKKSLNRFLLLLLAIASAAAIYSYEKERHSAWHKIKDPATVAQLKQFIALKEAQAHASTNRVLPDIQALF